MVAPLSPIGSESIGTWELVSPELRAGPSPLGSRPIGAWEGVYRQLGERLSGIGSPSLLNWDTASRGLAAHISRIGIRLIGKRGSGMPVSGYLKKLCHKSQMFRGLRPVKCLPVTRRRRAAGLPAFGGVVSHLAIINPELESLGANPNTPWLSNNIHAALRRRPSFLTFSNQNRRLWLLPRRQSFYSG